GGFPSIIVDSGGQLGDIVARCIGLNTANFTEITYRMRGVSGAASNSNKEQPSSSIPYGAKQFGHLFNAFCVDLLKDLDCVTQILLRISRGKWPRSISVA